MSIYTDSDSDTPTESRRTSFKISKFNIQDLSLFSENSQEKKSVFEFVDVQYLLNILRHQAAKKNNYIYKDDLILCLDVITKDLEEPFNIENEVEQLFKTMSVSVRSSKQMLKTFFFEELIAPLILLNMHSIQGATDKEKLKIIFETFRMQFALKLIQYRDITNFLTSTYKYLIATSIKLNKQEL